MGTCVGVKVGKTLGSAIGVDAHMGYKSIPVRFTNGSLTRTIFRFLNETLPVKYIIIKT